MNQYLVFESNTEKLGIGIENVERIVEYNNSNELPNTRDYLLGVTQYNDIVLPLVDLTLRLYGKEVDKNIDTKVIVVSWGESFVGIVVDRIIGIKNFEDDMYEDINGDMANLKGYVKGFIKLKNDKEDILFILDMDKLFKSVDGEKLKAMLA